MADEPNNDDEFREIVLTPPDDVEDGTELAPKGDGDTPIEPAGDEAKEGDKPEEAKSDEEKDPLRDDKGRFKKTSEGRIAELTYQRREAERQRDAAIARLQEAQGGEAPTSKPIATDYADYGEYVEALTDWKVAERERTNATKTATDAAKAVETHQGAEWGAKLGEAKIAMPDYDAVIAKSADLQVAGHVTQAIVEADRGPELLYHLAQHPEIVGRLNDMSANRAAIELGRIEATLKAPAEAPKPRETTRSTAPAPITPVPAGSSSTKDPSKMSMDEYKAFRAKLNIR